MLHEASRRHRRWPWPRPPRPRPLPPAPERRLLDASRCHASGASTG